MLDYQTLLLIVNTLIWIWAAKPSSLSKFCNKTVQSKICILGFVPLFTNGQKKLHKGRKSNLSKSLTHFSHYRSNFGSFLFLFWILDCLYYHQHNHRPFYLFSYFFLFPNWIFAWDDLLFQCEYYFYSMRTRSIFISIELLSKILFHSTWVRSCFIWCE